MSLRIRRGTNAQRAGVTFFEGELVYTTDTKKLFVGDGTTVGGVAVDSTAGSINNLTDVDTTGVQIGQILQWNGTNFIPGDDQGDKESVTGADSTILVDATNSSINLDGTVKGHIIPDQNEVYNLGSSTKRFNDLFLSGTTIDLGGTTMTSSGGKLSFSQPIVASMETSGDIDTKDNNIINTAAGGDVSIRPSNTGEFNVANSAGARLFEVDLTNNSFGAVGSTVLQLPVYFSADYTAHSSKVETGQLVFDNTTKALKLYNGNAWVSVEGGSGSGGGIVEGSTYDISISGNVIATDSSVLINTALASVNAKLVADNGDVIIDPAATPAATNIIAGNVFATTNGTHIGNVTGDVAGELTGNSAGVHTGNVFGDTAGTHTGNVVGNVTGNTVGTHTGDSNGLLTGAVVGSLTGDVFADDSTRILNSGTDGTDASFTGSVTGALIGNVTGNSNGIHTGPVLGDVVGSVFNDDSTTIIDGLTGAMNAPGGLTATTITASGAITASLITPPGDTLKVQRVTSGPSIQLQATGTNDMSAQTSDRGKIVFQRNDTNGEVTEAIIAGGRSSVNMVINDGSNNFPETHTFIFNNSANFGLGKYVPASKLHVAGSITADGGYIGGVQAISGPGAINVTTLHTEITTTGADAYTLANGVAGQLKIISMKVDGGNATLTPTTLANGTTITFDDVNDSVTMIYSGLGWLPIAVQGATVA